MIKLKRDSGYADRRRAYKVIMDDDVIGEIRDGQEVQLETSPGRHQLFLKIDWCTSNVVEFNDAGTTLEFECGSNLRGLRVWFSIIYSTVLSNQYIWLRQKI